MNAMPQSVVDEIVSTFSHYGEEGHELASFVVEQQPRLLKEAMEKGVSKGKVFSALRDALEVYAAELACGVNVEVLTYSDLAVDVFSLCDEDYLPAEEFEMVDDPKVDDVIDAKRKEWMYDFCTMKLVNMLMKKGARYEDAMDIASGIYERMLCKRVDAVFARGIPECDAEWAAFLKKDAQFAYMNYYKESWRHPTSSLDETMTVDGREDEGEELSRLDALNYDEECVYQPNRKDDFLNSLESQHELQYVRDACACLWKGSGLRMRKTLEKVLFDEADVCDMNPGTVYTAKSRYLNKLKKRGCSALERIEAQAA